MESVEPLVYMYDLCDDAFCQDTIIHGWRYNVFKVTCPTLGLILQHQRRKWPSKKKQKKKKKIGHQLRATKWRCSTITSHEKSISQCVLSTANGIALKNTENHRSYECWAHCKLSFLRQNMLYMQRHFLCNISYAVTAASMGNSLKYTTMIGV